MGSQDEQLSRLLFGPTRSFITRCVIAELKKLGESFSETLAAARKLDSAKCNHEPLKSGADCLEGLVEGGNVDHFWVATQDTELRKKLRQAPSVAIVFSQNNFLVLEPPSEKQLASAHASEAQRIHATEREYRIIEARERKKEAITAELEPGSVSLSEDGKFGSNFDTHWQKKSIGVKDRPQFKRKQAKGPNPLSCKKKSIKSAKKGDLQQGPAGACGEIGVLVRSRKRRPRKKKKILE